MNKATFITELAVRTGRPVRNPKTGAPVMLNERTTVRFKPGKGLFEAVNSK